VTHPYASFGDTHFWNRSVTGQALSDVPYDPAPKFRFNLRADWFATAGSCFAQHFGRELAARGGNLMLAEDRHPLLIPEDAGHGYGVFSARYGNLYNTRQLKELLDQAFGLRPPIFELCRRADGQWIDMLRPRAVPDGFSSEVDARTDRIFHLGRVRRLIESSSVLVFTLGLTEAWRNHRADYTYGICPGVVGGAFDSKFHEFVNFDYDACRADLFAALEIAHSANPNLRVLLTVSPVMLVATAEERGVLQSSIASKSILRAVADCCARSLAFVDYFPSFEIIAGPPARGCFFDAGGRDVSTAGVDLVMDVFFSSRFDEDARSPSDKPPKFDAEVTRQAIREAFAADCDEVMLDSSDRISGEC
jgi:hypothetical protein